VLRTAPSVERVDTPAVLSSIAMQQLDLPVASHVQLWPHRHGTDAMFIQLLTKVNA
jgi:16S rRNA (cytosine967-C5)-methyltransferase